MPSESVQQPHSYADPGQALGIKYFSALRLNEPSFANPASASSIFSATGSAFGTEAFACWANYFLNTSSPSSSPTDHRNAVSFLNCPLVSVPSSIAITFFLPFTAALWRCAAHHT